MYAEERQRQIVRRVRGDGQVSVIELSDAMGVTPETIRRDLRILEKHGLVRRVHGGAFPHETAGFESTLSSRTTRMVAEKQRIAKAAVKLLGDAESVFIDEGYLPQLIAEALPVDVSLTVVTAALPIASLLSANPLICVIQLGGQVRERTVATAAGWPSRMLESLVVDLAFVGANGVSLEHGMTTPDPAVADVKQCAVRSSRRAVFVGDHTKFGKSSFCRFAAVQDFSAMVTDSGLRGTDARRYQELGPQVIRA